MATDQVKPPQFETEQRFRGLEKGEYIILRILLGSNDLRETTSQNALFPLIYVLG